MLMVAILAVVSAAACAYLAHRKGRSPWAWGALGLVCQWLALIVLALLPQNPAAEIAKD